MAPGGARAGGSVQAQLPPPGTALRLTLPFPTTGKRQFWPWAENLAPLPRVTILIPCCCGFLMNAVIHAHILGMILCRTLGLSYQSEAFNSCPHHLNLVPATICIFRLRSSLISTVSSLMCLEAQASVRRCEISADAIIGDLSLLLHCCIDVQSDPSDQGFGSLACTEVLGGKACQPP